MITTQLFSPTLDPIENMQVGSFVNGRIWQGFGQVEDYCSLGVFDGDDLIAGVLYHNYYPENGVIEFSAASISKKWLTRPVLRAMFGVPFDIFNCQMCVVRVSSENDVMLRIARSFGFSEYVIPRLRGRHENEHVFTLTDDQWQNHRVNKNGKERS